MSPVKGCEFEKVSWLKMHRMLSEKQRQQRRRPSDYSFIVFWPFFLLLSFQSSLPSTPCPCLPVLTNHPHLPTRKNTGEPAGDTLQVQFEGTFPPLLMKSYSALPSPSSQLLLLEGTCRCYFRPPTPPHPTPFSPRPSPSSTLLILS